MKGNPTTIAENKIEQTTQNHSSMNLQPGAAVKKRTYHVWRLSQDRQLRDIFYYMSDRDLAQLFGTTEDAIEIRRRRLNLRRPGPYFRFSPGQVPLELQSKNGREAPGLSVGESSIRKPSVSALFLLEEEKYNKPTLQLIESIKPLVDQGQYQQAQKQLENVPYEQYDYMLEKCDPPKKSLRDCLTASLRWVFRVLDARSLKVNARDLQMLEKSMKRKCGYC
jgi:hypothetical protein